MSIDTRHSQIDFVLFSSRHPAALVALLAVLLAGCLSTSPPPGTTPPADSAADAPFFTPEPPPLFTHDGIRLATLNAEFLFDGVGDEGQATFPHQGDPDEARRHRERIGRVLRMLDADLILLAEVENEHVLELLIEETLADEGYHAYFVEGRDRFTGQDVALLARVPVDTVGRTDRRVPVQGQERTYGVSKNLFARLHLGDQPVTLIGLHLLARPDDWERKPRREAQAEVIRRLVADEVAAGRAVAVLGDFNDFDDAVLDRGGNRPITDVLARIKAAGPDEADDLHNLLADVPPAERFTSHYDRNRNDRVDEGELSAIDHILLSPALYRRVRAVHFVQAHDPASVTDHFPIVVTLAR